MTPEKYGSSQKNTWLLRESSKKGVGVGDDVSVQRNNIRYLRVRWIYSTPTTQTLNIVLKHTPNFFVVLPIPWSELRFEGLCIRF